MTVIAFLNCMGWTHSILLLELAVEIWEWCIQREVTLHAEHLPGVENIRADWMSCHLVDSSDWRLKRMVFLKLEGTLGRLSIGLFTSRMNVELETYCSWGQDAGARAVVLSQFLGPTTTHTCSLHSPSYLSVWGSS